MTLPCIHISAWPFPHQLGPVRRKIVIDTIDQGRARGKGCSFVSKDRRWDKKHCECYTPQHYIHFLTKFTTAWPWKESYVFNLEEAIYIMCATKLFRLYVRVREQFNGFKDRMHQHGGRVYFANDEWVITQAHVQSGLVTCVTACVTVRLK